MTSEAERMDRLFQELTASDAGMAKFAKYSSDFVDLLHHLQAQCVEASDDIHILQEIFQSKFDSSALLTGFVMELPPHLAMACYAKITADAFIEKTSSVSLSFVPGARRGKELMQIVSGIAGEVLRDTFGGKTQEAVSYFLGPYLVQAKRAALA